MSVKIKRKRIYDGDEARHLFEALYFTERDSESDTEQRTTGLSLRLSYDSDTSTSSLDSSDSELSVDGLTSSPCSRATTSNVANDSQGNAGVENKVRLHSTRTRPSGLNS